MSNVVHGESCMFVQNRSARLLFPAGKVLSVYNSVTGKVFKEGVDYTVSADGKEIRLTEASSIPFFTQADMYPVDAIYYPDPAANAVPDKDGRNIRFDAKLFFAENQIEVDYEPVVEDWPQGSFLPSEFRPQQPIRKIVTLGDSITEGYNASAYIGREPFRKPYAGLVADALGAELVNLGLNGASSRYLQKVMEKTVAEKPDLITIAFGMNDLETLTPQEYIQEIDNAVSYFRKELPGTALLLVSPMTGNGEWHHTPVEATKRFSEALQEYAKQEKLPFADVYSVWYFAVTRKDFFSLTGNGVNHPNDFGHSIYAKVILATLGC